MRAALIASRITSSSRSRPTIGVGVGLRVVARAGRLADVVRGHRALLALDEERLLLGRVRRPGTVEHVAGGEDVARLAHAR